jgi:hypothetical protein
MESSAKGFSTGHYGYARLEGALGAVLGAGEDVQRGALRSRLKRLAQLGVPAPLPDLEGRRSYSMEECHQLLVALLLGNVVHDPTIVAPAVIRAWKHNLRKSAIEASKEATDTKIQKAFAENPLILHAKLQVVTQPWRTGDPNTAITLVGLERLEHEKSARLARAQGKRSANLFEIHFLDKHNSNPVEWTAFLNYTDAANDLHRALHRS